MGKVTFYRMLEVPWRKLIVAWMPIFGALLFLIGSPCWKPNGSKTLHNTGATLFLIGSLAFTIAPFLDAWEIYCKKDNLADLTPSHSDCTVSSKDATYEAKADYEELYKGHLMRMQGANAVIYAFGGLLFAIGSVLFYPHFQEEVVHANWISISGCFVVTVGASLGVGTAYELKKTAPIVVYKKRYLQWSDEDATIISCSIYIFGTVVFIVGLVFFLPSVLASTKTSLNWAAVGLFMVGSACFMVGAIIDLLVLLRVPKSEETRTDFIFDGSVEDGALAEKKHLLENKPLLSQPRGVPGCCA